MLSDWLKKLATFNQLEVKPKPVTSDLLTQVFRTLCNIISLSFDLTMDCSASFDWRK